MGIQIDIVLVIKPVKQILLLHFLSKYEQKKICNLHLVSIKWEIMVIKGNSLDEV